jgi:GDSL-like lipase/acylhydrolase family protein
MSNSASSGKGPGWLKKLSSSYTVTALVVFNTLLAVLLVNLALAILFHFRGPEPGTADPGFNPSKVYPEASLARVYRDFSREERNQMLYENWSRRFIYDDYVMFKERPYSGKYVNVSPASFRAVKDQGPWPPQTGNVNVFVFGGSTTFGYGLPDRQTIPSFLQEALSERIGRKVAVYNFGTGWYNSTQERIRFERLLCSGHKPDMAVFIDGLNDSVRVGDDAPFRKQFEAVFDANNGERLLGSMVQQTPIGRLLRGLKRRLQKAGDSEMGRLEAEARQSLKRYLANKELIEAICNRHSITPVFVWQPVPSYKYDLKLHLFAMPAYDPTAWLYKMQKLAYEEMAKTSKENDLGKTFLWCADLQEDEKECVYVDGHHYTAKFARKLAETIAQMMAARGLVPNQDSSQRQ